MNTSILNGSDGDTPSVEAFPNLLYFQRHVTEIVERVQPEARKWRIAIILSSLFTIYNAYFWIVDLYFSSVTFHESLKDHPLFVTSSIVLLVLFLVFNIHKRIVSSKLLFQRKLNIAIPEHLAVLFLDANLIDFEQVTDFVIYAANSGIKRVSFYDPWSIFFINGQAISDAIASSIRKKNLKNKVSFDESKDGAIRVKFLGADHGVNGLVKACKLLSLSQEEITSAQITDTLAQSVGIFEPDLLLKVGPSHHSFLAGYPPFSLRVTEIVDSPSLRFSSVEDFQEILRWFGQRDRRLGR